VRRRVAARALLLLQGRAEEHSARRRLVGLGPRHRARSRAPCGSLDPGCGNGADAKAARHLLRRRRLCWAGGHVPPQRVLDVGDGPRLELVHRPIGGRACARSPVGGHLPPAVRDIVGLGRRAARHRLAVRDGLQPLRRHDVLGEGSLPRLVKRGPVDLEAVCWLPRGHDLCRGRALVIWSCRCREASSRPLPGSSA